MSCPRCSYEGDWMRGGCPRCGYGRPNTSGPLYTMGPSETARPLIMRTLMRGDVLGKGRYRLIDQLSLPENQQGVAWLATDTRSPNNRVEIREVTPSQRTSVDIEQAVHLLALRLAELAQQHPGFPRVIDTFGEQGAHYLVLQYPEGESLASLLKRQGGALPERVVAEYGRQLSEMLYVLSRQQPPLVHGSINPDTIVVSPDRSRVSLIHLPLFPPGAALASKDKATSGYLAPEQVRGMAEPASDVYGLAATLYHAVTGYDPHERMAFFHPPARRLNPTVTPSMEAILVKGLRLSASQRYVRPSDMQKDFSSLIASYPPVNEHPVDPDPVTNALRLNSAQLHELSRNRSLLSTGIFAVVGIVLLIGLLFVFIRPFAGVVATPSKAILNQNATATSVAQQQVAFRKELALEAQSFQKKGIGISDGRFVFDTYPVRANVDLKTQAAQAIQQGDMSSAVNLLTKATSADPTDGEAQIYNEDIHILQSGVPYVTVVLGLAIDNTAFHLVRSRAHLEGAFLAQHEINTGNLLPRGLHLRLLIDNSGVDNANVATVAQFVANRVALAGNPDHIIALVGWPFSSQTINARDIIASVHLPIVSQAASSVKLSGSSPYFFRVNPADDAQGSALGTFAVRQLHAKVILVLRDPTDPYSVSLAGAFTTSVKALHAIVVSSSVDTFTEGSTPVDAYQKVIDDAVANKVDVIFQPGFDVDAVRFAHALGNASRADPLNTYLATLKILGGDGVDTGLLLGQGSSAEAKLAVSYPQDMQRLIFSAFADANEWNFEKIPQNQQPIFFSDWSSTYQSSAVATSNALAPGNDAILCHDAVAVIAHVITLIHGPLTGQAVRDALASLGQGSIPAFQGVSGRILFNEQGNPVDKAIVVLDVERVGSSNAIVLDQVTGMFR